MKNSLELSFTESERGVLFEVFDEDFRAALYYRRETWNVHLTTYEDGAWNLLWIGTGDGYLRTMAKVENESGALSPLVVVVAARLLIRIDGLNDDDVRKRQGGALIESLTPELSLILKDYDMEISKVTKESRSREVR